MAILNSINEARRRGADDDTILQSIIQGNPNLGNSFKQAQQRGAQSSQIIDEIIKQNPKEKEVDGFLQKISKPLSRFSTGFTKELLERGRTLGKIGQEFLQQTAGRGVEKITGVPRQELGAPIFEGERPEALKPVGRAEEIGAGVERVAEFFVPGTLITKGLKARLAISTASDALQILSRVGIGAAETAGVTALQKGTPGEIAGAGAFGALIPGGPGKGILNSAIAKPAIKFLTESLPSRMVNSILRPVEKSFDFGRNPGQGVVGEGITANTRGQLLTKISEKKQEIGSQIGTLLGRAKDKVLDLNQSVLKPIDEAIEKAVRAGEQALVTRLQSVKDGLTKTFKLGKDGKVQITGDKNLVVNPGEAQKIKIELGQNTRWTGQAFDNDINKVRVQVYRNINNLIDGAVSGSIKLNQRYANLLSAEKSLERSNKNIQRLVLAGLRQTGIGGIGFGASIVSGESFTEATLKGLAVGAGFKLAGSVAVKTRAAKVLNSLGKTQRDTLFEVIPGLRNLILGITEKGE